MFTKKNIMQKMIEVSGSTMLSRMLGIIREVLMMRYLGASALSDAFLTAYKIPNSLRKIFAEGALSAAFIPTIVKKVRSSGKKPVNSLMTLGFLIFEGMVLALCALAMWHAEWLIRLIAPGFSEYQVQNAVPFLQVVMPFIFFVSSSALLAGALQSVGHFFVPAFSPVLLNIVFISALLICLSFNLPVIYLCWFILLGGFLQLMWHLFTYFRLEFGFSAICKEDIQEFGGVLTKFFLCLLSMSVVEINLFIDTSFASYLAKGSMSLLYYANRFMGIPLGVFAVAFSTILLPHFSRVSTYAPKRLSFYLLESAKFVFWVTIPVALVMGFFSEKIFHTIFLSKKFDILQVQQASYILVAFLIGLFFFSLNKILLNIYYALHETAIPALVAAGATAINIGINWLLLEWLQAPGLALATTISGIVQTALFVWLLHWRFNFALYFKQFGRFLYYYCIQLLVLFVPFLLLYKMVEQLITLLPTMLANFLLFKIGFWLWAGPLSMLFAYSIFYLRHRFKVRLYFID